MKKRPRRTKAILGWTVGLLLVIGVLALWAADRFAVRHDPELSGQPGPLVGQPSGVHPSDSVTEPDRPSPESTDSPADLNSQTRMVELPNGWQIGEPVNLGPPINSGWNDSDPTVTADGLTLLFGSNRPGESCGLWMSTRTDVRETWGEPARVGLAIDEKVSRFGAGISSDGLILLFTADRPGGMGGQDLWQATRTDANAPWGEPVNLGPVVNSNVMDVSPSLSNDGLTLLFASSRPAEDRNSSIWMTTRPSMDRPWGEPVKLGPTVNCSLAEGGPDLSSDGLALVFESRREGAVGAGDLWMCTRSSIDEPWGEAVNLGYHVNSTTWDAAPVFAQNDTAIYYSSRKPKRDGQDDSDIDVWMVPVKRPKLQGGTKPKPENVPLPEGIAISEPGWDLTQVHRSGEKTLGIAFHPKDNRLYTSEHERGIRRFDENESVQVFDVLAVQLAFASDGESVYCFDTSGSVLQMDWNSGAPIRSVKRSQRETAIVRFVLAPGRFKGTEVGPGEVLLSEFGTNFEGGLRRLPSDGETAVQFCDFPDGYCVFDICFATHRIYAIRAYFPPSGVFDASSLKQTLCCLDKGQLVPISTNEPMDHLGCIVYDHVTSDLLVACADTNRILRVHLDEQGHVGPVSTVLEGFGRIAVRGLALSSNGQRLAVHDQGSHTAYVFSRSEIARPR